MRAKYGINSSDLDIILFLYSEKYFTYNKYQEINTICKWDKKRFDLLITNGWVELFIKKIDNRSLYKLTTKSVKMCTSIYRKLHGEEIPTHPNSNPMFARNVSFSDKIYRNMIKQMNELIKQKKLNKALDLDDIYD
jgi:hypothetical protein